MNTKRKHLSPAQATEWAQMAHALYLEALMAQARWSVGDIAFHGGTSLRLSWSSSRYSEDLDFLLSRGVGNLDKVSRKVAQAIGEMARRVDSRFVITVSDKSKNADRMASFLLSVSHRDYIGTAKIKAEFWRTDPAYLERYPTQLRTPQTRAAVLDFQALVTHPVPAATLETAYADKLVAFATRPYLKWRDLYDLWWIGTQTATRLDMPTLCRQFLHNLGAYNTLQGLPPAEALALFLSHDRQALVAQADPDLKTWLPEALWKQLQGDGVRQMVDYVFQAIGEVCTHLRQGKPAPGNVNA